MNWIDFTTQRFELFILVFARVLTILSLVPFFGTRQIPTAAKLGFSYFIALLMFPVIPLPKTLPAEPLIYFSWVLQEVLIGTIIGFVSFIMLTAVQVGGQLIDMQMGFGIANVINPFSNTQQSLMAQMQYLLAIFLFMALDGHHLLLLGISQSFRVLPLGHLTLSINAVHLLTQFMSRMFMFAFQIAFPTACAIFLSNLTLGFLSRLVPQMNVFFVGVSVTILVGFTVIFVNLANSMSLYHSMFQETIEQIMQTFRALNG